MTARMPTLALTQLRKGQRGQIAAIASASEFGGQDARVSHRLQELGFVAGAELEVLGFGLFGHDPVAVRIAGSKFALRRTEASKILLQGVA